MNTDLLPDRLQSLFARRESRPTLSVTITDIEVRGSDVKIGFRATKSGVNSTAVLKIGNKHSKSEILEFMNHTESEDVLSLLHTNAEVDISKFPQFVDRCKKPPSELMIAVANQPQVVERTEIQDDENQTMEELLYERFRTIRGVSDGEAKRMAEHEALDMGHLSALKISESVELEAEKER
jgi:hypothetical protein